jgi:hypothetical protein
MRRYCVFALATVLLAVTACASVATHFWRGTFFLRSFLDAWQRGFRQLPPLYTMTLRIKSMMIVPFRQAGHLDLHNTQYLGAISIRVIPTPCHPRRGIFS